MNIVHKNRISPPNLSRMFLKGVQGFKILIVVPIHQTKHIVVLTLWVFSHLFGLDQRQLIIY